MQMSVTTLQPELVEPTQHTSHKSTDRPGHPRTHANNLGTHSHDSGIAHQNAASPFHALSLSLSRSLSRQLASNPLNHSTDALAATLKTNRPQSTLHTWSNRTDTRRALRSVIIICTIRVRARVVMRRRGRRVRACTDWVIYARPYSMYTVKRD